MDKWKDSIAQSKINTHIRQSDFISDREFNPETTIFELTLRYDFGQYKLAPAGTPGKTILHEEL